jgi:hypothetical protein
MFPLLCDIVPCGEFVYKAQPMCEKHYRRFLKHGNPNFIKLNPGRSKCIEDKCDNRQKRRGYCNMHWRRIERNGTPERVRSWNPPGHRDPSYETLHMRIKYGRGPAKNQDCVDCGGPAAEWSYSHSGEDEYEAWCLSDKAYYKASNDIYQYEPRCKQCHTDFDGSQHERLYEAAP